MRVTESRLLELASQGTKRAQKSMGRAITQATTGLRVATPSDDPVAYAEAMRKRGEVVTRQARESAIARSSERLSESDRTLESIGELLSRAHELAVQLGADSYNGRDRQAAAKEVRALKESVLSLANAKDAHGEALFAGSRVDGPAFDPTSGVYLGDENARAIAALEGELAPTALTGGEISSGTNPLVVLDRLAVALEAQDGPGIRALLTELGRAHSQVADARSQIGRYQSRLNLASDTHGSMLVELEARTTALLGAEPIAAAQDLARAQAEFETARTVAKSVLDLLRSA